MPGIGMTYPPGALAASAVGGATAGPGIARPTFDGACPTYGRLGSLQPAISGTWPGGSGLSERAAHPEERLIRKEVR